MFFTGCCASWKPQHKLPSVIQKDEKTCIILYCMWNESNSLLEHYDRYVEWYRKANDKPVLNLNSKEPLPKSQFKGWTYTCENKSNLISALQINELKVSDTDVYWCQVTLRKGTKLDNRKGTKSNLTVTASNVKGNSISECENIVTCPVRKETNTKDSHPESWHAFLKYSLYASIPTAAIVFAICFYLKKRGFFKRCNKDSEHLDEACCSDERNDLTYAELSFDKRRKKKSHIEMQCNVKTEDYTEYSSLAI
ncbi:uncharacterized protein LOC122814331 [Protopterus annectens]|uniref:uncharacterized protein LOC122814331 n=1 Tax=Protopterus annectens TaxID=7888 RepID=UPI001CFA8E3B|nr:uncharacterized protein LOC122814331 [Protopterus annectens]